MQRQPVQFDLPPSIEKAEPPLPRLKWVWPIFIFFFAFLIVGSLSKNDQKSPVLQNAAKLEEKSLEMQLCMKSYTDNLAMDSGSKPMMFDTQIDDLLDKARKEPHAQKLRIVLRQEDRQKPFLDDIRNLAKSKSPEDQAFAKLYGDPKPKKDEAMQLLKKLDGSELSERLAAVQIKESFGDKEIRRKTFDPTKVTGLMVVGILYFVGLGIGTLLWIYYYFQRQSGRLAARNIPLSNIDWGQADRLLFVALMVIGAYFVGGTAVGLLVPHDFAWIELLAFVPVFAALFVCLRVPIFGWRIMPEKVGLSLKDFPQKVGWAIGAFFANIPVLTAVMLVASFLIRALPGGDHPVNDELLNNPSSGDLFRIFFLACVIAPIWEEIYFRGLLFPAFTKAFGKPIQGALLSSFIFAAIHPQGAAGIIALMAIALMLCTVSYQTKSLVSNIILHGMHNAATLVFFMVFAPLLR